jgi:hypothetical protein
MAPKIDENVLKHRWARNLHFLSDDKKCVFIKTIMSRRWRFIKETDGAHMFKSGDKKFLVVELERKDNQDIAPKTKTDADGTVETEDAYPEAEWDAIYADYQKWERKTQQEAEDKIGKKKNKKRADNLIDLNSGSSSSSGDEDDTDANYTLLLKMFKSQKDELALLKAQKATDARAKLKNEGANFGAMGRFLLQKTPVYNPQLKAVDNKESFAAWFKALKKYDINDLADIKLLLSIESKLPKYIVNSATDVNTLEKNVEKYCAKGEASSMRDAVKDFDSTPGVSHAVDVDTWISDLQARFHAFEEVDPDCVMPEKLKAWFALVKADLEPVEETVIVNAVKQAGGMNWDNFKTVLSSSKTNNSGSSATHPTFAFSKGKSGGGAKGEQWCDICEKFGNHSTKFCFSNKKRPGGAKGDKQNNKDNGGKGGKNKDGKKR